MKSEPGTRWVRNHAFLISHWHRSPVLLCWFEAVSQLCCCHCLPCCGGCDRDWNNNASPRHLLTPEGGEEFCRNLHSVLHYVSICLVPGFYSSESINSSKLPQPWLCHRCQDRKLAQTRLQKLSEAASTFVCFNSDFSGTGCLRNGHVILAGIICECCLCVLGSASVDCEACL